MNGIQQAQHILQEIAAMTEDRANPERTLDSIYGVARNGQRDLAEACEADADLRAQLAAALQERDTYRTALNEIVAWSPDMERHQPDVSTWTERERAGWVHGTLHGNESGRYHLGQIARKALRDAEPPLSEGSIT